MQNRAVYPLSVTTPPSSGVTAFSLIVFLLPTLLFFLSHLSCPFSLLSWHCTASPSPFCSFSIFACRSLMHLILSRLESLCKIKYGPRHLYKEQLFNFQKWEMEFISSTVVKTLPSNTRAWVRSLVGELKFHLFWGAAKNL